MVRAFAGDSTITSRVPLPFPLLAPFPLVADPLLSPLPEAAAFLLAALLLAGTLFPTSHPRHGPSTSHRSYHTRRGHEMPVPAVIPATRLPVRTVPERLPALLTCCLTSGPEVGR